MLDGFANEAAAAAEARDRAEQESDPVVRDVLERIAGDEERHAALGLKMAMWALAKSPEQIIPVVRTVIRVLADDPSEVARTTALPCVRALLPWLESQRADGRVPVA